VGAKLSTLISVAKRYEKAKGKLKVEDKQIGIPSILI